MGLYTLLQKWGFSPWGMPSCLQSRYFEGIQNPFVKHSLAPNHKNVAFGERTEYPFPSAHFILIKSPELP